jgi:hypothetical protein
MRQQTPQKTLPRKGNGRFSITSFSPTSLINGWCSSSHEPPTLARSALPAEPWNLPGWKHPGAAQSFAGTPIPHVARDLFLERPRNQRGPSSPMPTRSSCERPGWPSWVRPSGQTAQISVLRAAVCQDWQGELRRLWATGKPDHWKLRDYPDLQQGPTVTVSPAHRAAPLTSSAAAELCSLRYGVYCAQCIQYTGPLWLPKA